MYAHLCLQCFDVSTKVLTFAPEINNQPKIANRQ